MSVKARDTWLDVLRAAAIVSVVAYHSVLMAPGPVHPAWLVWLTGHGYLGVDLFFVLSGWLIGGLYWRERSQTGRLDLLRFWLRRWIRTIPPYLVALVLSWIAVAVTRHEPWDWRYLVFAQNYTGVNYFQVSWSLCVEEHFYLLAPLVALLAGRWGPLSLVPVAIAARLMTYDPLGAPLQFITASHLRWDGLVLGFAAAGLPIPRQWTRIALIPLAAIAVVLQFVDGAVHNALAPTAVALAMLAALMAFAGRITRESVAIRWVAAATYSIYLSHALMIHVALIVAGVLGAWSYFPAALVAIAAAGTGFYLAVERPALRLRDRLAPVVRQRAAVATVAGDQPVM